MGAEKVEVLALEAFLRARDGSVVITAHYLNFEEVYGGEREDVGVARRSMGEVGEHLGPGVGHCCSEIVGE